MSTGVSPMLTSSTRSCGSDSISLTLMFSAPAGGGQELAAPLVAAAVITKAPVPSGQRP